jgi:hypothetical protein
LRDSVRRYCAYLRKAHAERFGGWLARIGKAIGARATVGNKLDEIQVRGLFHKKGPCN